MLAPDDHHHLERVLRLRPGQPLTLGDGAGRWREARFGPLAVPSGKIAATDPPPTTVTVAFVPVKAQGPEWYVQKLTELGVDEIVPLVSTRSVVRWDEERAARQQERMTKVAREACMQSRRLFWPRIGPLTALEAFLSAMAERGTPAVLTDPAGAPMGPGDTVLVIGPEGGFSPQELALAAAVALPGHILRAETAAVAAATIACGLRSGVVGSAAR